MKTVEEYHKEIKENAVEQWAKEGHSAFKNMENDPVINLLLSALSYQGFHIQQNIEQYEEKMLRDFRDRIIPFQLIKPVPAFSIVETKMAKTSGEAITEKIMDETCSFEFKKIKFVPLLKTKIINAELKNINQQGNNIWIELQSANPVENLSGMSFYIDTPEPIDIESIRYGDDEFPLIKPSQYNELPFTQWFNNAHLLLNQNHYLFGTYDYWKELFLTNTSQLFYIDQYETKEIPLNGQTSIELEIILSSSVNVSDKIRINCIPVVNVEKKGITLNDRTPVQDLSSETGEFLNLLYDNETNMEEYMDSFIIRQHGVERYNRKQLLEQMQEMLHRYDSDYYAFLSISELKNSDKLKRMQEVMDELSGIVNKLEKEDIKGRYYALLKKNKTEIKNVHLDYLTTSGASANGIRKEATKVPNCLDRNKTVLLFETQGGRDSIKNETQKEEIAKYYFQTKDRLVTPADIRTFILTFYYEGIVLGDKIKNIPIDRKNNEIVVTINLKDSSLLETIDKKRQLEELQKNKEKLEKLLQTKITLKSTGIMPFLVNISE